jgi:hypothetical protein
MPELLQLGDDVLEGLIILIDTTSLGRLMMTCKDLKHTLSDPRVLLRLAEERNFPTRPTIASSARERRNQDRQPHFYFSPENVDSVEALAVMESVCALESHHIIFHLASLTMVNASKKLLKSYAALMRRHSRLRIHIDSHTGVGAPPHIAPTHSVRRACVAAKFLVGR